MKNPKWVETTFSTAKERERPSFALPFLRGPRVYFSHRQRTVIRELHFALNSSSMMMLWVYGGVVGGCKYRRRTAASMGYLCVCVAQTPFCTWEEEAKGECVCLFFFLFLFPPSYNEEWLSVFPPFPPVGTLPSSVDENSPSDLLYETAEKRRRRRFETEEKTTAAGTQTQTMPKHPLGICFR